MFETLAYVSIRQGSIFKELKQEKNSAVLQLITLNKSFLFKRK